MSLDILPRKTTTTWITWTLSLQVSDAKVWETGGRNVRSVPISYHLGWHLWHFLWWWQKTRKIGSPCHPYHRPGRIWESGNEAAEKSRIDWKKGMEIIQGRAADRCFGNRDFLCWKRRMPRMLKKFCSEIPRTIPTSSRIPTQLAFVTIWKNGRQKITKWNRSSGGGALVAPKDLFFRLFLLFI